MGGDGESQRRRRRRRGRGGRGRDRDQRDARQDSPGGNETASMSLGNGETAAREPSGAPSLPVPREADTARHDYPPPAYESPAYEPPAYEPPAPAPQLDAPPAPSAKPASTYTVWSSTPGDGRHFGPKE